MVGSKVDDTFDELRRDWFGTIYGLHIDSDKKRNYVDGYKINLKKIENNKLKNNKLFKENIPQHKLWSVIIGGYEPSSIEAKSNAISKS